MPPPRGYPLAPPLTNPGAAVGTPPFIARSMRSSLAASDPEDRAFAATATTSTTNATAAAAKCNAAVSIER